MWYLFRISIITVIFWKSEKRFEVSTFEGSLFSGYRNFREAVTFYPYFGRFAILSRGRYFWNFTVDFPWGLYLVKALSTGILNYNIVD